MCSPKYALCFKVLFYCLTHMGFCINIILFKFNTVSSSGTVTYSEVKAFLENKPDTMIEFKSIATINETLILTGNHLIFARQKFAAQFNPM